MALSAVKVLYTTGSLERFRNVKEAVGYGWLWRSGYGSEIPKMDQNGWLLKSVASFHAVGS